MIGLDTSVVLRLLIGEPVAESEAAQALLAEVAAANERCHLHDLVVAESWHALRAHYGVPDVEAARALLLLVDDPVIVASPAARQALAAVSNVAVGNTGGAGFMDRLIHAAYEGHGHIFATFDRKAGKLPGARLLRGGR
ncbi:MAG: hypothetical protein RLZZ621_400 [Gemmatimonadota bacterium]